MPVRVILPKISEREFTTQVVQLAKLNGYRVAHFRPGLTRSGKWRTAMQGDIGFPDLVIAGKGRVIFAELKVGKAMLTEPQQDWLLALVAAGVPAFIWRPTDWPEIKRILTCP